MELQISLPHSKVPATCPFLSQLDPIHIPTSQYLNIHLKITITFRSGSPQCALLSTFPHQNPVHVSPPNSCYMPRPSHSSRFITRKIFDEQNRSLSSSLCRLATPLLFASSVHYRRAANQLTTNPRPLVAPLAPTFAA
jgi:hypothetical protein